MDKEQKKAKQYLVIRKDLNMRKGKIAAQAAHASCKIFTDLIKGSSGSMIKDENGFHYQINHNSEAMDQWINGKFVKIGLYVESESELLEVYQKAKDRGLLCCLIKDAGITEFNGVETYTAVGIGPVWEDEVVGITDHLKPY